MQHKKVAMILGSLMLTLAASIPANAQAQFKGCKAHPTELTCSFTDPFVEGCNDDSHLVAFAFSPDNYLTVGLRYSPSCQSAWTVVRNDSGLFRPRVRTTIVSNDGLGSTRDGFPPSGGSVVTEMLYVGPEQPYRTVQAIGRLFDGFTGQRISIGQTPFVDPY